MPGIQTLETDVDTFRMLFDYLHYRCTNRVQYIYQNAYISLQMAKHRIDSSNQR